MYASLYSSLHFHKSIFYSFLKSIFLSFWCFWRTFLAINCTVIFYSTAIKFCSKKEFSLCFQGQKQNWIIFYRAKLTTFFVLKAKNKPKLFWHFLCTVKNSSLLLITTQKRFKTSKKPRQIWVQHVLSCYLKNSGGNKISKKSAL